MLTNNQKKILTEAGGQAPSGGNIQPWRIKWVNEQMEIYYDKQRSDNFLNVNNFATLFSIGSFIENVVQAAISQKLSTNIQVCDDSKSSKSAVIQFDSNQEKKQNTSLFKYIKKRTTNRKFYDGTRIDDSIITHLQNVVEEYEYSELAVVSSNSQKNHLGKILGEADIIRTYNDELFGQMMDEMRWTQEEVQNKRDGLDIDTLELPKNVSKILYLLKTQPKIRKLFPRSVFAQNANVMIKGSSHIGCISITGELTTERIITAGRALQKMWLLATKEEVSIQPWTVLSFFWLRMHYLPQSGFRKSEEIVLKKMKKQFCEVFHLSSSSTPFFIFRAFKGPKPSQYSNRRHFHDISDN